MIPDDDNPLKTIRVSNADEAVMSPSGKQIAFIKRGEVFVTDAEYSSVKQITHTPEGESDVIWGKNDRELYYTSERDGHYNIYMAKIARQDDPNFSNATLIAEKALFPNDGKDRTYPSLSPDGKKLAFILDRNKLMVMDLKSKKVKELTDGSTLARRTKGFKAHWSPDSRWIAIDYIEASHDPYGDIAVINVADGKLTKITATGYFDENPRWVMDGNAIMFISERYGMRNHASWGSQYDVMITFLNKDAYDRYRLSEEDYALLKEVEKSQKKDKEKAKKEADSKKKDNKKESTEEDEDSGVEPIEIDLTNLDERTVRLTPASADICDAILTDDGQTLYYMAAFEDKYDLWKMDLRKKDAKIANKLNSGPMGLELDNNGNIFLLGSSVKKLDPKNDKIKSVSISTDMKLDPAKEREYMLRYVYNEEKERFFRTDMNGADWDNLYKAYAKFLPHINNNYDFSELLRWQCSTASQARKLW